MLAIAHRAGNSLVGLRRAAELGVHIAEADVHSDHGRLEVRHAVPMTSLPFLRDGIRLTSARAARLTLPEVLRAATEPRPRLMLDLKGADAAMGLLVARTLQEHAPGRVVLVCAGQWAALEPLAALPWARPVLSAGSPRQLSHVDEQLRAGRPCYGVSVHHTLLDAAVMADLHRRVELVMAWTVNRRAAVRALSRLKASGTIGVISDRTTILREVLAQ